MTSITWKLQSVGRTLLSTSSKRQTVKLSKCKPQSFQSCVNISSFVGSQKVPKTIKIYGGFKFQEFSQRGQVRNAQTGICYCSNTTESPKQVETDRRGKKFVKETDGPFRELGIKEVSEKVGGIRLRQHVNPLKKELQVVTPPPVWDEAFEDPSLPLHVDVGCGHGRFALLKATREPENNFLGLDIRNKLTDRGNKWSAEIGVNPNVHFLFTNATISLRSILESYPGKIFCVSIQFPDPHFKNRHHKRRVVQPSLVDAVAECLMKGGQVFLQSDVKLAAEAMRDGFEKHSNGRFQVCPELHSFDPDYEEPEENEVEKDLRSKTKIDPDFQSEWSKWGWLEENPMGVPTEREVLVSSEDKPVYRVMLRRC